MYWFCLSTKREIYICAYFKIISIEISDGVCSKNQHGFLFFFFMFIFTVRGSSVRRKKSEITATANVCVRHFPFPVGNTTLKIKKIEKINKQEKNRSSNRRKSFVYVTFIVFFCLSLFVSWEKARFIVIS